MGKKVKKTGVLLFTILILSISSIELISIASTFFNSQLDGLVMTQINMLEGKDNTPAFNKSQFTTKYLKKTESKVIEITKEETDLNILLFDKEYLIFNFNLGTFQVDSKNENYLQLSDNQKNKISEGINRLNLEILQEKTNKTYQQKIENFSKEIEKKSIIGSVKGNSRIKIKSEKNLSKNEYQINKLFSTGPLSPGEEAWYQNYGPFKTYFTRNDLDSWGAWIPHTLNNQCRNLAFSTYGNLNYWHYNCYWMQHLIRTGYDTVGYVRAQSIERW